MKAIRDGSNPRKIATAQHNQKLVERVGLDHADDDGAEQHDEHQTERQHDFASRLQRASRGAGALHLAGRIEDFNALGIVAIVVRRQRRSIGFHRLPTRHKLALSKQNANDQLPSSQIAPHVVSYLNKIGLDRRNTSRTALRRRRATKLVRSLLILVAGRSNDAKIVRVVVVAVCAGRRVLRTRLVIRLFAMHNAHNLARAILLAHVAKRFEIERRLQHRNLVRTRIAHGVAHNAGNEHADHYKHTKTPKRPEQCYSWREKVERDRKTFVSDVVKNRPVTHKHFLLFCISKYLQNCFLFLLFETIIKK
jgi:hypothetical protein